MYSYIKYRSSSNCSTNKPNKNGNRPNMDTNKVYKCENAALNTPKILELSIYSKNSSNCRTMNYFAEQCFLKKPLHDTKVTLK